MADASARKLLKVTRNGDEWSFRWAQGTKTQSFSDTQAPDPELINEMNKVLPYAVEAAPWIAPDYRTAGKLFVSSVAFDWKGDDDRRNAVVTMNVIGKPVPIKSDKRLADNVKSEAKMARWEQNAVAQFDKVVERAFAYIDGERAQIEMPILEDRKSDEPEMDFDNELEE